MNEIQSLGAPQAAPQVTPPQGTQPVHPNATQFVPQQPAQPTSPQYSSEQTMQPGAGDEIGYKVSVTLDKEAMKILEESSLNFQETIVNLGIKLFAKTNVYKEYMLKADFKTLEQETSDLQETVAVDISQPAPQVTTSNSKTATTTAPAQASGGFTSW